MSSATEQSRPPSGSKIYEFHHPSLYTPYSSYYTFFTMECKSKEAWIQLAVNAFKKRSV